MDAKFVSALSAISAFYYGLNFPKSCGSIFSR
jgi:hypothetical protein